jgi:hypothetical protein
VARGLGFGTGSGTGPSAGRRYTTTAQQGETDNRCHHPIGAPAKRLMPSTRRRRGSKRVTWRVSHPRAVQGQHSCCVECGQSPPVLGGQPGSGEQAYQGHLPAALGANWSDNQTSSRQARPAPTRLHGLGNEFTHLRHPRRDERGFSQLAHLRVSTDSAQGATSKRSLRCLAGRLVLVDL